MTMASKTITFLLLLLPLAAQSHLTPDYYHKTCPNFANIVQEVVVEKQLAVPTTAAGVLRVFFHDCIIGGCDASILITSSNSNTAERDSDINKALPGDAFDLVIRAKTRLELECPGIVSCADVLAEATRDLVSMTGGPNYTIRYGRKDSLGSHIADVEGHIARPNMTISHIIKIFAAKGLNVQEMVALTGSHTLGFTHCSEFAHRIFDYSKKSPIDPTMNPTYADGLRKLCANYRKDSTLAAFNDPISPGKFDNAFFQNIMNGVGLLQSDSAMATDPRTKPFVELYARNETEFFRAYARAMQKVSLLHVTTGKQGEVRRRCDAPNSLNSN